MKEVREEWLERQRSEDERFMAMALEAARRGRPSPNPHVGAVIVDAAGAVVGVGHHERAGEAHAEVAAIADAGSCVGLTLYVTMEPCNHHGRTGPCTEAVLAAGLERVVVGARDPAPHVPGAIERLREAGIRVDVGVLGDACTALVSDFAKHIRTGLPFVTLKAAVTLDGRMATRTGDSKWITGAAARTEAHRMRDRADAVLVGIGTALADDPALTVRHVDGRDPLRVVIDSSLRLPTTSQLAAPGTLVLHSDGSAEAEAALVTTGAEVERVGTGARVDLGDALRALGKRDIVRLLVEGGPTLHAALLHGGHADRAAVFIAPKIVGDTRAMAFAGQDGGPLRIADAFQLVSPAVTILDGGDLLIEGDLSVD